MLTFLIFVVAVAIAYLVWRIVDQLPDIVYRLGEIQRDVADLRRQVEGTTPEEADEDEDEDGD